MGNLRALPFSLVPKDRVFFDLFAQAGGNSLRAAKLLQEMLKGWPESAELACETPACRAGGRPDHPRALQADESTFVTPIDPEDIYGLAGKVDDIVDHIEETADFMGLYAIEAPMDQALAMADVLVKACVAASHLLEHLRGYKNLDKYWIEIHRLENDGDRLFREAFASLFAGGTDPMVVIRWRDIFLRLERAIDATEDAATVVETIATKYASDAERRRPVHRRRHGARVRLHQRLPRHG